LFVSLSLFVGTNKLAKGISPSEQRDRLMEIQVGNSIAHFFKVSGE